MDCTVIVGLQLAEGNAEAFKSALEQMLPETRKFEGFVSFELDQDQDDPNHFVMVESWTSRAHHEKYFAWRTERGDLTAMMAMLTAPPAVTYLDPVAV